MDNKNILLILAVLFIGVILGIAIPNLLLAGSKSKEEVYQELLKETLKNQPIAKPGEAQKARYIFGEIPDKLKNFDVNDIIKINTLQDINSKRSRLKEVIWGHNKEISNLPIHQKDVKEKRFQNIKGLTTIDKLTVEMDQQFKSHIFHLNPQSKLNKLLIIHSGHEPAMSNQYIMQYFLDKGFSVLVIAMQNYDYNIRGWISFEKFGPIFMTKFHSIFRLLDHPIKYFVEPVIMSLNHMKKFHSYDSISMTGVSGGGWSTTILAALDTRIKNSFPVAGSLPFYLRTDELIKNRPATFGDFEQYYMPLYKEANYLEMYVMGASGDKRKQVQILNKFDPCCFSGINGHLYGDKVSQRVQSLGQGSYKLFIDDTHKKHQLSKVGLELVHKEIISSSNH